MAAFQAKFPEADFSLSSVGSGAAQAALWGNVDCAKKPVRALCVDDVGSSTRTQQQLLASTVWGIGGGVFDAEEYDDHAGLGLQQLPALGGPVVLVYSKDVTGDLGLDGDAGLNMTFGVIAGIFNGTTTHWDDDDIQALDPRTSLPHERITTLVREDKSGMSATFTESIQHAVPTWEQAAVGKLPTWPLNLSHASKTSTSCASTRSGVFHFKADGQTGIGLGLLRRPFSVGYLELGYSSGLAKFASQVHVASATNPTTFVKADARTLRVTMAGSTGTMDPITLDTNLAKQDSPDGGFPISRYAYWYLKRNGTAYADCYQAWLLCTFIKWTYEEPLAAEIALDSGWVVPPVPVVKVALAKLNEVQCIDDGGATVAALDYVPRPYRQVPSAQMASQDQTATIAGLSIAGGLLLLAAVVYGIWLAVKRVRMLVDIKRQALARQAQRVRDAIETTTRLNFPMQLVRAKDFLAGGALVQHEDLRDAGKLITIDGLAEAYAFGSARPIVFFSHQWTAFGAPDHTNQQYATMCFALQTIVAKKGWDMRSVVVWVDFSSIPQTHPMLQGLAINSLAAYASAASAFVVVAPTVMHKDLPGQVCDAETYKRRGWCRAEQLCHSLRKSTEEMWVADESGCSKMVLNWFKVRRGGE